MPPPRIDGIFEPSLLDDSFLSYSNLHEMSQKDLPVFVTLTGGMEKEFGSLISVEEGQVVLSSGVRFKARPRSKDPVVMIPCKAGPTSAFVTIRSGVAVSRVVERDLSFLWQGYEYAGFPASPDEKPVFTSRTPNTRINIFIDEPVDPIGDRCLFETNGIYGGADLSRMMHRMVPPSANSPCVFGKKIKKDLVSICSHISCIRSVVFMGNFPKDPHSLRKIRAKTIWKEWAQIPLL